MSARITKNVSTMRDWNSGYFSFSFRCAFCFFFISLLYSYSQNSCWALYKMYTKHIYIHRQRQTYIHKYNVFFSAYSLYIALCLWEPEWHCLENLIAAYTHFSPLTLFSFFLFIFISFIFCMFCSVLVFLLLVVFFHFLFLLTFAIAVCYVRFTCFISFTILCKRASKICLVRLYEFSFWVVSCGLKLAIFQPACCPLYTTA